MPPASNMPRTHNQVKQQEKNCCDCIGLVLIDLLMTNKILLLNWTVHFALF